MNVVDAFVVTLGLDASTFTKAQREVVSSLTKTKDAAVKAGQDVEKSAQGITEGLSKATSGVLDLMAAFLGGRGIKQFVEDAVRANTSLGNFSSGLGASAQWAAAWGIAVSRMGGSAQSAYASIQTVSDALTDLHTMGKTLPDALFLLQAKSGKNIDLSHGVKQTTIDLAAAGSELAKTDHATANRLLRLIGYDNVMAELMIRQGPRMKAWLEMQQKLTPSDKDVAAAGRMTDAQAKLRAEYDLLASKVMTALAPALIFLADKLGMIIDAMAKWVEANPGWTEAITVFLTTLAGAKILSVIKNILALRTAILGLTAANEAFLGGGLIGFLATNPWIAGLIAGGAVLTPGDLNAGEDERKRQEQYGHGGGSGSGNDALRRRAGGADLKLGPGGKLSDNQKEAYQAARAEGLSETAARALVANMSGEGLPHDAHRVHWDGSHYAHGIVQWDDDRSAKIKAHFGKAPEEMSVAEQTKAAIWEIRNTARFAQTKRALEGDNAGAMIGALVGNYEQPRDKFGAIAERSRIYQGLGGLKGGASAPTRTAPSNGDADYQAHRGGRVPMPATMPTSSLWNGSPHLAQIHRFGAAQSVALSNIASDNRATTTNSSNESHAHIANLTVNAPNATDAHGIAGNMREAMIANNVFGNYGPA